MEREDLPFGSLHAAADALAKRKVSAVELLDAVLARIERINPRLGAFTDLTAETARKEARAVDAANRAGTGLAGIPIAIKDIIDCTPAICSAGMPFLADRKPDSDAPIVRRLRKAGAVIPGVTATDPGAFGVRTIAVTHPQAPDLTVGGSSGGSGAAIAAGLSYGALGTDTGGSIRIPVACCMIAGLMPTYGKVSADGVMPLSWSADHIGPMARSAADLALFAPMLDPAFGHHRAVKDRIIIGHAPEYWSDAEPAVRHGMDEALAAARSLGAEIREVAIPSPDEALAFHVIILASEAAAYHFQEYPDRLDEYPAGPRRVLAIARNHRAHEYIWAMRTREQAARMVNRVLKQVDFLMVPTLPVLPPRREAETVRVGSADADFTLALIRYTCLFDHTGNPVVSLPASVEAPGIGSSVQIVARRNADGAALSFAAQLEQALALSIDYSIRF